MPTWSDSYLQQLLDDGEMDLARRLDPIYARYSLAVTQSTATYTLNDYTLNIVAITWKGKKLYPRTQKELIELAWNYKTEEAEPQYYARSGDGLFIIRFYPIPNETIGADDSNIFGSDINGRVIISCYRTPDLSLSIFHIPDYIARRTIKAYAMSKAFRKEGVGQNIRAADYWEKKYNRLVGLYEQNKLRSVSRKQLLPAIQATGRKPQRPQLARDFTIG